MRTIAFLAVLALAVAGCNGGKGGKSGAAGSDDDMGDLPMLHGYIVDPAIRPLEGVTVKVLDSNVTTATDEGGYFGFDGLPTEQFLVIIATKEGFIAQSKQVTLVPDTPVRLNFTLLPEPIKAPSKQVLEFEGFLGCQIATIGPTGNNSFSCNASAGQAEKNRWDFSVEPELAGAVIEIYWDPVTDAGTTLGMRLETLELGQLNVILGEEVGTSPLAVTVPQSAATKYYPQGGLMRLTLYAASDAAQNEAGVGYDVVAQQSFNAYASLFYIDPPPSGYTINP